ncbi:MAG: PaREP1 family protein [Candidatus Bathyarchaeia archaeon]
MKVKMVVSRRVELVKHLFSEAEGFLAKKDSLQSSEKLYKAAEECIKILSERFNLEESKTAGERWVDSYPT